MPEVSKKDMTKLVNGVPQLTTALTIAQNNKWITLDEATKLFCFFASYLGYEIDPQTQIDAAAAAPKEDEKDYDKLLADKLGTDLKSVNDGPAAPANPDNIRSQQGLDDLADSIQERMDTGTAALKETIEGRISGLQKELTDDISALSSRMTDRPSINITTPPVNVEVKIEKGKVKKTIAYTDIEGNPKAAEVTEEDL
jgi:hypothetical protein